MTTKTTRVKNVQPNGTWETNGTTYFKFEYELEDGTVLTASHQSATNFFNIYEEVEYEITKTNQYGNYGKVRKPQAGGATPGSGYASTQRTPATNDAILIQTCAKITADLYIHLGSAGLPTPEEVATYSEELAKQLKKSLNNL
jgi:hypothetical protein